MMSVKVSVYFWAVLVLFAQFHCGYSLFLGYKKDLLKHKLYKVKEALVSAHHDALEEVHYHYKPHPVYVPSVSYSKWPSSYGKFSSYSYGGGWPSYGGWHY